MENPADLRLTTTLTCAFVVPQMCTEKSSQVGRSSFRHLGFARWVVDTSPRPWSDRGISTAHAQAVWSPATLTAVKPLQAVGMGLVIVVLTVPVAGYDVLADPLGWLLVLVGLFIVARK